MNTTEYKDDANMNRPWITKDGSGKPVILPQVLYMAMKAERNILVTDEGNLYIYNEGCYKPLRDNELIALIKDNLPVTLRNRRHWEAVRDEFKTDHADVKEDDFDDDENIVPFENGVLNLQDMKLYAHDPKYLVTRKVNANYLEDVTLDEAPRFKQYLVDLVDEVDNTSSCLLEFFGLALSNVKAWRTKKLLLLVGVGNSGKTVFRQLLINILGEENTISIELKRIQDRFGTAPLHRKRLAGSGDMEYVTLEDVNILKSLVGGDTLFAEKKFENPFSFRYNGALMFNANRKPYFRGDRGKHVYSRFMIVECFKEVPESKRDPHLLDKLMEEKDVIASVAMTYLKGLVESDYQYTESETMQIARELYVIENNSLFTFVKECCTLRDGSTRRSRFNEAYNKWCKANHVQSERAREIGKQLEEQFGIVAEKKHGIYCYNLAIKTDAMDDIEVDPYAVDEATKETFNKINLRLQK